ncbi:MAG: hypothetical protein ACOC0O_06190 [Spirochaetota bacterium]
MRTPLLVLAAILVLPCRAAPADPGPTGNRLVEPGSPGLSGIFLLGEDDYYTHAAKMDAAPAIVHLFSDWIGELSGARPGATRVAVDPIEPEAYEFLDLILEPGTIVAITWAMPLPNYDVPGNAYDAIPNVQDILDGRYDDHIRDFARAIGRIDAPVMVTLFGEVDNNAFYSFGPKGRNSAYPDPDIPRELDVPVARDLYGHYGDPGHPDGPERVRDAFIRVVELFEAEGVREPSWFMYGSSGFMSATPRDGEEQLVEATGEWNEPRWYYPGDRYIEWVGKSLHHDDFESLRDSFEPAYEAWGEVTLRPFFSPEYSLSMRRSSRAAQIRREFGSYLTRFPRFKAFAIADPDPVTGMDEFGLMTLGGVSGEFPDEIDAWIEAVRDNPHWKTLPYTLLD